MRTIPIVGIFNQFIQKNGWGLIALFSFLSLIFAYGAEYLAHVPPCRICSFQRLGFGGLFFLSVILYYWPRYRRYVGVMLITLLIIMMGLSVYHVGLEQKWWSDIGICPNSIQKYTSIEELKKMLWKQAKPKCGDVTWRIASVSAVIWTLLLQIFLLILAFWTYRLQAPKHLQK
jgi:disulfide bond formation protein DsbB